ncbi:hypothetical protein LX99_01931 [Mucilaginibacter oryzae]|uniref:Uncharacterized protein n=1 Tax=Mucilaginibacter oryzae TaxID=468058 RepID=A0A316HDJ0_9SPHI|nr:hypothetical protein [Mucilaginibacter oryzae]PWK78091.1 hypothetical protein LX99_01931 [Mucilaginibacter oryzae]
MKINAKTAWLPIIITIVYAILISISIIIRLGNAIPPKPLLAAIEVTYILPIIYAVMVLKRLNEKKLTVATYTFAIFFDIALVLYYFFSKPSPGQYIAYLVLGALSVTLINIMIIQAFNLKTRQIVRPFCVYGFVFLLIAFFKLVGLLFMISHYGNTIFAATIPAEILLPIAMLYLFFGIKKYLKNVEAGEA